MDFLASIAGFAFDNAGPLSAGAGLYLAGCWTPRCWRKAKAWLVGSLTVVK